MAFRFGQFNYFVLYILKTKLVSSGTLKGLEEHDRRVHSLVRKNLFTTVDQINNALQEVGVSMSRSRIKRRIHQSKYRGFYSSVTTSCGQMRQRLTYARIMGREGYGEEKELLLIQSIPPHIMVWMCMATNGTIVYYLLRFSQMLQNSLDGASHCRWTMIRAKQPKTFFKAKTWNVQ